MFADVKFSLIFFLGLLNSSRTLKITMPFLRSYIRATAMQNFYRPKPHTSKKETYECPRPLSFSLLKNSPRNYFCLQRIPRLGVEGCLPRSIFETQHFYPFKILKTYETFFYPLQNKNNRTFLQHCKKHNSLSSVRENKENSFHNLEYNLCMYR